MLLSSLRSWRFRLFCCRCRCFTLVIGVLASIAVIVFVLLMSEGLLSPAASAVNQHLLIVSCFVSLYKGCVSLSIDKHVSCVPLRVPPRGVLSCRQPTSTCHGTPTAQTHLSNKSHASHLRPTRSCVTRSEADSLYKFNESKNPQHSSRNPRPRGVYSGMQHAILAAISRGACLGLGFSRESTTSIVFGMLEAPVWASEVSFRDSNAVIGQ
jgi:hypothetical protein